MSYETGPSFAYLSWVISACPLCLTFVTNMKGCVHNILKLNLFSLSCLMILCICNGSKKDKIKVYFVVFD